MLIVGLTGGIGTGKTQVSQAFATLGAPIIDTDMIARTLVAKGTPTLDKIIEKIGKDYLTDAGALNRKKCRALIVHEPEIKHWLENLLHPLIREQVKHTIQKIAAPYCIVVIPLLAQNPKAYDFLNRICVVTATTKIQLIRIMARDKVSHKQAKALLEMQGPETIRLNLANDMIHNVGTLEALHERIAELHQQYTQA